jgi:hypothetical protein
MSRLNQDYWLSTDELCMIALTKTKKDHQLKHQKY